MFRTEFLEASRKDRIEMQNDLCFSILLTYLRILVYYDPEQKILFIFIRKKKKKIGEIIERENSDRGKGKRLKNIKESSSKTQKSRNKKERNMKNKTTARREKLKPDTVSTITEARLITIARLTRTVRKKTQHKMCKEQQQYQSRTHPYSRYFAERIVPNAKFSRRYKKEKSATKMGHFWT